MDTSATKNNSAPAKCSGCGEAETGDHPLRWQIEDDLLPEYPADLYCDKCHGNFRQNYEIAEEALIAAIKAAKLHEVYTIEHLQATADSLFGCTTEAVTNAFEKGTMSRFKAIDKERKSSMGPADNPQEHPLLETVDVIVVELLSQRYDELMFRQLSERLQAVLPRSEGDERSRWTLADNTTSSIWLDLYPAVYKDIDQYEAAVRAFEEVTGAEPIITRKYWRLDRVSYESNGARWGGWKAA